MNAIILDTETHDLEGILIELGWVDLKSDKSFEQRYNPDCKIVSGAMAVHHIIDADVENCPHHMTVQLPEGIEYIIGHNIDYDIAVLRRSGIDVSSYKTICTLALARKAFPEMKSHSIGALMYAPSDDQAATRETLKNAHSALADVMMTKTILEKIIKKLGLGDNPQLLHIASDLARIPTVMPFGKHKGVPIADLDQGYISWALRNMTEMDQYLRKAMTKAQRSIP